LIKELAPLAEKPIHHLGQQNKLSESRPRATSPNCSAESPFFPPRAFVCFQQIGGITLEFSNIIVE
jgi:hypothetical protein